MPDTIAAAACTYAITPAWINSPHSAPHVIVCCAVLWCIVLLLGKAVTALTRPEPEPHLTHLSPTWKNSAAHVIEVRHNTSTSYMVKSTASSCKTLRQMLTGGTVSATNSSGALHALAPGQAAVGIWTLVGLDAARGVVCTANRI
eukprot:COSAG01_NODE_618_length_14800_cov_11.772396_5_plen_145_part_00